jgi:phenylacetate-CoA ligase
VLATPEIIREAAQAGQVKALLPRWRKIPLYREAFARPDLTLANLPVITKREMRAGFPHNFLHSGHTLEELLAERLVELEHTSGTSEDRLPVIFGHGWWNEQEERALRLNGFVARVLDEHPNARRATITSPACNGLTCPTVWMSQAQRTIGSALFVNLARIPFVLGEAELQHMADEITAWSPQFLDLDPVHGVWFALFCERHRIRFPSLRFVLCSYEFVSVVHRRILKRVFGVPVFNLYGSTETGHLLMENEAGEMKPSYDTAYLEVVDNSDLGSAVAPTAVRRALAPNSTRSKPTELTDDEGVVGCARGGRAPQANSVGNLIVTTLSNDYMPLLRYGIGDLAERNERSYGTDYIVHGRARDALLAANGQRVTTWQVDQCFVGVDGIAHYQLRQAPDGKCHLRYVPETGKLKTDSLRNITARLESLLESPVTIESVSTLVPEASGKFRLTCRMLE